VLNAATGMTLLAAKNIGEFPSDAVLEKFIATSAPTTSTAVDSNDLTHLLNGIGKLESTSDWQKRSDEFHERMLAEARAEIAAL
jgi:hypothetical protein